MFEPPLKELKGSSRLALGFFNSIIKRIECTKPIQGSGIQLTQQPDGILVSIGGGESGGAGSSVLNAITVGLNVCTNGQITTIYVYAPKQ